MQIAHLCFLILVIWETGTLAKKKNRKSSGGHFVKYPSFNSRREAKTEEQRIGTPGCGMMSEILHSAFCHIQAVDITSVPCFPGNKDIIFLPPLATLSLGSYWLVDSRYWMSHHKVALAQKAWVTRLHTAQFRRAVGKIMWGSNVVSTKNSAG